MNKISVFRIVFLCGSLLLTLPAMFAQYSASELLEWTEQHLNNGDCGKAQETYKLYKDKVPSGNAEVEQRITECKTPTQLSGNNKADLIFKVGDVTFKMVFVKGGTFQMGSDSGNDDEKPVHSVTVSDFYMGELEVTQGLWQEVMGTTVHQQRNKVSRRFPIHSIGTDYPMYYVSHIEAEEFCEHMNQRLRSQLPFGYCFALPTEAEWEYAARGGNSSNAYTYSGSNYLSEVGWYSDNSNKCVHQTGSKKANEIGIYDMSGNVCEWCADRYGYNYYSSSESYNPRGPSSGRCFVRRGGDWFNLAKFSRVSYRNYDTPDFRLDNIGFRLALVRR